MFLTRSYYWYAFVKNFHNLDRSSMCKKVLLNINIIIRYFNFRPEIRSASEFVSISEYKMECDQIEGFLTVITAMFSKMLFFFVFWMYRHICYIMLIMNIMFFFIYSKYLLRKMLISYNINSTVFPFDASSVFVKHLDFCWIWLWFIWF